MPKPPRKPGPLAGRREGSAVRSVSKGKDKGRASPEAQARDMAVRVKTAKGRKLSSSLWLERQLNDPYVAAAKRAGYRSRAAFKLIEIDDRFRLLRKGGGVVDLGAAPGGWAQVAVERAGPGHVVGIDLLEMDPVQGAVLLQGDFLEKGMPDRLKAELNGPVHLVLSDMAGATTGHRSTDHLRIIALCEAALAFAREVLAPGGSFCAKIFQGGTEGALLADMKRDFAKVVHVKPKASRQESSEVYVVATGFRGRG